MERALDKVIREVNDFCLLQVGFRPHLEMSTQFCECMIYVIRDTPILAVLDLRGAYPSVPRKNLLNLLRLRLPEDVVNMYKS